MDLSVFDKTRSIEDYKNAYDVQKQQLASGKLDQLNKQNIYATQLLAGAAGSGNQAIYDNARKQLSDNGIDVSGWAPDVQTGLQQATAARNAQYTQNPLLPLANLAVKQDANNIQNAQRTGDVLPDPNATSNKILQNSSLANVFGGQNPPAQQQPVAKPWVNPDQLIVQPQPQPAPQPYQGWDDKATIANSTMTPTQTKLVGTLENGFRAPDGSFLPPQPVPGKDIAYNNKQFDKALDVWKNSPVTKRSQAGAEAQGKQDVKTSGEANAAEEAYNKLDENLKAMEQLLKGGGVPSSKAFIPASWQASLSRNFDSYDKGKTAEEYTGFNTLNAPTALNVISELMKGGQIRGNQYIEKMIGQGFMIDPDFTTGEKLKKINEIRGELKNAAISARNISQKETGGDVNPYQAIPTSNNLLEKSKQQFNAKKSKVVHFNDLPE